MNGTYPVQKVGLRFTLTVRLGPDAGVAFQLSPPKVTIGRGEGADVSLTDPKISRLSAVIEFTQEAIVLKNLSERVMVFHNGQSIEQVAIQDGDIIRIASTEMLLRIEAVPLVKAMQISPHQGAMGLQQPDLRSIPIPNVDEDRPRKKKLNPVFLALVCATVLGGAFLFMDKSQKKAKLTKLTTTTDIENDIKKSQELQHGADQKRIFKNEEERTRFMEAQKHFLLGFRDYQKGQFDRALTSFKTATIIDNKHSLASRYQVLAEKSRDEAIANKTLEGKRYREKSMYKRCSAAFDKVMDDISNHNDLRYREAAQYKKECDSLAETKYDWNGK
jgi:hypothetical protein